MLGQVIGREEVLRAPVVLAQAIDKEEMLRAPVVLGLVLARRRCLARVLGAPMMLDWFDGSIETDEALESQGRHKHLETNAVDMRRGKGFVPAGPP